MTEMVLQSELDVGDAAGTVQDIRTWVSSLAKGAKADFELSSAAPTQVSLQIFFAAVLSARDAGFKLTYGPNAEAVLANSSFDTGS